LTNQVNDAAQLLSAAQLAASRAAAFLREQEGRMQPAQWASKGRADFVTQVDRKAEEMIGDTLLSAFPDSIVMGEELNPTGMPSTVDRQPSTVVWVVDPLDGTTNFLHRFPQYAVSIAALVDGALTVGLVHDVPRGVRFSAIRGSGAWMDGKRIEVSRNTDPSLALIGTGFPFSDMTQWERYRGQLERISQSVAGIRRPGSAALDLCDVACGRFEGFWEARLAPWDVAAGALIIREAGGQVSTFTGEADVLKHSSVVAGNPAIHAWLMKAINTQ
jgi:myo-inositol-1(or 4)-monophosphatase